MKFLISGASGLIGQALARFLKEKGHSPGFLVRRRPQLDGEVEWDPDSGLIDTEGLEGHDVIVHLAGENLAGRWTSRKKARIKESRVKGTLLLSRSLAGLSAPPAVLVSASAVGYYGNRGEEILNEESGPGRGFLADVCCEWEDATLEARKAGIRVVNLRIGAVMSPQGGALTPPTMLQNGP